VLILAIVALAPAECAQIVGVLLVFMLMVGPAAPAQRLTSSVGKGILLSAALALFEAWGGITLAHYTDWPASFWITALCAAVYPLSTAASGRNDTGIFTAMRNTPAAPSRSRLTGSG